MVLFGPLEGKPEHKTIRTVELHNLHAHAFFAQHAFKACIPGRSLPDRCQGEDKNNGRDEKTCFSRNGNVIHKNSFHNVM